MCTCRAAPVCSAHNWRALVPFCFRVGVGPMAALDAFKRVGWPPTPAFPSRPPA